MTRALLLAATARGLAPARARATRRGSGFAPFEWARATRAALGLGGGAARAERDAFGAVAGTSLRLVKYPHPALRAPNAPVRPALSLIHI